MDEIRSWLNSSKEYTAGVALYLQYGKDKLLKSLFTREAETDFKRERLFRALKSIYDNYRNPTTATAASQRAISKQSAPENYKYWPPIPIADPVVSALYEQWKPLYAELMNISARVYDVAVLSESDHQQAIEACKLVHRILDLDDQCDQIYAKRDYYYQHGKLAQEAKEEPAIDDPVRWATSLSNAERYVRQYRNALAKKPHDEKAAAKLLHYKNEVAKLRALLKLY